MKSSPSYRITPWVGRLIIANAVVLLLLMTLFTSREIFQALQFSPRTAFTRPWTFVSYIFVHAGLLHLFTNMLMLYVFGTPVESRWAAGNYPVLPLLRVGAAVAPDLGGICRSGLRGASGAGWAVAGRLPISGPDAEGRVPSRPHQGPYDVLGLGPRRDRIPALAQRWDRPPGARGGALFGFSSSRCSRSAPEPTERPHRQRW